MKEMFKDIKKDLGHYLVLLFILTFGTVAFFYFQRYPQAQIVSLFLTASFYVLWGIVHHYLEGNLHIRIILEYAAVAVLGFVILWTMITRT